MSHDLEFRARSTPPDSAAIERYFDDHPWITPDPTDPRVEWYFHPTTEVTLRYERLDAAEDDHRIGVGFTVDYLAPHVIANEALEELRRFTAQFDLEVIDLCDLDSSLDPPRIGARRSFETESPSANPSATWDALAFLRSYDRGNYAAYQVHYHPERDEEPSASRPTLPSDTLAGIWSWNAEVADHDDEPVIVPAITCLELFGVVQTATTWISPEDLPTGQAVRLPAVDLLIVADAGHHDRTPVLVPFGDVECPREVTPDPRSSASPRLATLELTEADVGACALPDLAPLASSPWVTVPFRTILDREWVDALRGAT